MKGSVGVKCSARLLTAASPWQVGLTSIDGKQWQAVVGSSFYLSEFVQHHTWAAPMEGKAAMHTLCRRKSAIGCADNKDGIIGGCRGGLAFVFKHTGTWV